MRQQPTTMRSRRWFISGGNTVHEGGWCARRRTVGGGSQALLHEELTAGYQLLHGCGMLRVLAASPKCAHFMRMPSTSLTV